MEAQGLQYLERVRQGYLREAQLDHERIVVVNADQPADAVQAQIRQTIIRQLPVG